MYVCMYVRMYVCRNIYIYICIYISLYVYAFMYESLVQTADSPATGLFIDGSRRLNTCLRVETVFISGSGF